MKTTLSRPVSFNCAILMLASVIAGCASVTLAPSEEDQQAKMMQPESGRALVYVFRDSSIGGAFSFMVSVDNVLLGPIRPDQYYALNLPPQKVKLVVEAGNSAKTVVPLEAGHTYYFRISPIVRIMPPEVFLGEVFEFEGKRPVGACKLIRYVKLE